MRSTQQDRDLFAARLRDLLEGAGITQAELRQRLADVGVETSRTAVSNWAAGRFAPDRPTTRTLDQVLGAGGQLLDALGYQAEIGLELTPETLRWIEQLDADGRHQIDIIVRTAAAAGAEQAAETILIELKASQNRAPAGTPSVVRLRDEKARDALMAASKAKDPAKQTSGKRTVKHPGGADTEDARR